MKTCSVEGCKQINPQAFSSFHKQKGRADGYHSFCKSCRREYYESKREHFRAKEKEWREANREKLASKRKENREVLSKKQKEYYKNNPDKIKEIILKKYFPNLTREERLLWYKKTLQKQNYVCAICKNPERQKQFGKTQDLAVDHNHITEKVRGLLCADCNSGIGRLKESPAILHRAIDYLNFHLQTEIS